VRTAKTPCKGKRTLERRSPSAEDLRVAWAAVRHVAAIHLVVARIAGADLSLRVNAEGALIWPGRPQRVTVGAGESPSAHCFFCWPTGKAGALASIFRRALTISSWRQAVCASSGWLSRASCSGARSSWSAVGVSTDWTSFLGWGVLRLSSILHLLLGVEWEACSLPPPGWGRIEEGVREGWVKLHPPLELLR
jgi:hypothetical protein